MSDHYLGWGVTLKLLKDGSGRLEYPTGDHYGTDELELTEDDLYELEGALRDHRIVTSG